MARTEHTYRAGDVAVQLIVPDGISAPSRILLTRTSDGAVGTFTHHSVRTVRGPIKQKPRPAARQSKITEDWKPSDDEMLRARESAPSVNLEHETAQFVDWAIGKGESRADWTASWRRWIRETHKRNLEKGWKPPLRPNDSGKARWLREHGVSEEEYEQKKGDAEWLEMIRRRGKVA